MGWLDPFYCPAPELARQVARSAGEARAPVAPVWLGETVAEDRRRLAVLGARYFGDGPRLARDKFGDHYDYKYSDRFQLAARDFAGRSRAPQPATAALFVQLFNRTLDEDGGARETVMGI